MRANVKPKHHFPPLGNGLDAFLRPQNELEGDQAQQIKARKVNKIAVL